MVAPSELHHVEGKVNIPTKHIYSHEKQPHKARRDQLLKAHPSLRQLEGADHTTAFFMAVGVAVQFTAAYAIKHYELGAWSVVGLAYLLGAVVDHGMWTLIHDTSHNLTFASNWATYLAGIFGNLPLTVPSAISFIYFHRFHHGHLNEAYDDPDLPGPLEQRVFGNSAFGKAAWLLSYPIIQSVRTISHSPRWGSMLYWCILNWVVQLAANAAVVYYLGWAPFAYLVMSLFFSVGLHPLGARWIAEHYATNGDQETYSYYGSFNMFAFNVGHHQEHHDLPTVSWRNLPKIRAMAPEFYDWERGKQASYPSYWKLLLRFIFDPKFTLASRVVRANVRNE